MLTYEGKGYSPAFITNFDSIVSRVNDGEEIELHKGPDDICAPLLQEDACAHCVNDSVTARDTLALEQLEAQNLVPARVPFALDDAHITKMREAFAKGLIRQACEGCEWHGLCSEVAQTGFKTVRLKSLASF